MSRRPVNSLRLIWLEAFVQLAEQRSYKKAGESLRVCPTDIKKYVVLLEKWKGNNLFEKGTREIIITGIGKEFLSDAKSVIKILYRSRSVNVTKGNMAEMVRGISHFGDAIFSSFLGGGKEHDRESGPINSNEDFNYFQNVKVETKFINVPSGWPGGIVPDNLDE